MWHPQTTKKMLDPASMKSCQTDELDEWVLLNISAFHRFHTTRLLFMEYQKNNVYAMKPTKIDELRATIERECMQISK